MAPFKVAEIALLMAEILAARGIVFPQGPCRQAREELVSWAASFERTYGSFAFEQEDRLERWLLARARGSTWVQLTDHQNVDAARASESSG